MGRIKLLSRIIIIGLIFLTPAFSFSQVNVDLEKSTVPYVGMSSYSSLQLNETQKTLTIPIPFGFSFLGKEVHTVTVEANGYLSFEDHKYTLAILPGIVMTDSSHVSYRIVSENNEEYLQVEFYKCGYMEASQGDYLSFQVTLSKVDNGIKIHFGPSTLCSKQILCMIGIVDRYQDSGLIGKFISGNPNTPSLSPVNENDSFQYLESFPCEGITYKFTPISE